MYLLHILMDSLWLSIHIYIVLLNLEYYVSSFILIFRVLAIHTSDSSPKKTVDELIPQKDTRPLAHSAMCKVHTTYSPLGVCPSWLVHVLFVFPFGDRLLTGDPNQFLHGLEGWVEPVPWMANVLYPLNQLQLISSSCLWCCLKRPSVVYLRLSCKVCWDWLTMSVMGSRRKLAPYLSFSAFSMSLTPLCSLPAWSSYNLKKCLLYKQKE